MYFKALWHSNQCFFYTHFCEKLHKNSAVWFTVKPAVGFIIRASFQWARNHALRSSVSPATPEMPAAELSGSPRGWLMSCLYLNHRAVRCENQRCLGNSPYNGIIKTCCPTPTDIILSEAFCLCRNGLDWIPDKQLLGISPPLYVWPRMIKKLQQVNIIALVAFAP